MCNSVTNQMLRNKGSIVYGHIRVTMKYVMIDIRVVISNKTVSTSVAGTAYPRLPPIFSVVRVAQSLADCVVFCRSFFVFLSFSFGHYIACSTLIYGFWLSLWCLQNVLIIIKYDIINRVYLLYSSSSKMKSN